MIRPGARRAGKRWRAGGLRAEPPHQNKNMGLDHKPLIILNSGVTENYDPAFPDSCDDLALAG